MKPSRGPTTWVNPRSIAPLLQSQVAYERLRVPSPAASEASQVFGESSPGLTNDLGKFFFVNYGSAQQHALRPRQPKSILSAAGFFGNPCRKVPFPSRFPSRPPLRCSLLRTVQSTCNQREVRAVMEKCLFPDAFFFPAIWVIFPKPIQFSPPSPTTSFHYHFSHPPLFSTPPPHPTTHPPFPILVPPPTPRTPSIRFNSAATANLVFARIDGWGLSSDLPASS